MKKNYQIAIITMSLFFMLGCSSTSKKIRQETLSSALKKTEKVKKEDRKVKKAVYKTKDEFYITEPERETIDNRVYVSKTNYYVSNKGFKEISGFKFDYSTVFYSNEIKDIDYYKIFYTYKALKKDGIKSQIELELYLGMGKVEFRNDFSYVNEIKTPISLTFGGNIKAVIAKINKNMFLKFKVGLNRGEVGWFYKNELWDDEGEIITGDGIGMTEIKTGVEMEYLSHSGLKTMVGVSPGIIFFKDYTSEGFKNDVINFGFGLTYNIGIGYEFF
ncbi:hypothetical protein [Haliovirga abyssi]|uniref:Outer membrane protein beta-barrel domain-containing protein n=1 Tax=Haliovirga abyssi TaxID=2996794 RepID=A0AAU9DDK1_9FUSO|nr:hypothetical protein [Haliovirga abyssi]BDU51430.1 hypothetical protein HLVA_19990 [Haliovirga abyssi]